MELQAYTTTQITDIFREYDITATLQRVEIAKVMLLKKQHVSAEQVLEAVNRGRGIVSKATVYNTLRLFASKGIIKEVIVDPSKVFYEPSTTAHHHFFNIDTGELTDFDVDFPLVENLPMLPDGLDVVGVDVTVRVRGGVS